MMNPQNRQNTTAVTQQKEPPRTIREHLERIEASIADLQVKVDKDNGKEKVEKRKASRSTVTLAFAFLGFKIGGLLGGKAFIGKEAYNYFTKDRGARLATEYQEMVDNLPKQQAQKASGWAKIFPWLRKQPDQSLLIQESTKFLLLKQGEESAFWKRIAIYTGITGGIGAIIGAVIGWTRGDRLDDPYELIKHPIESFKKIFGPPPKDHKPLEPIMEKTEPLTQKPQELEIPASASSAWQAKMEQQAVAREANTLSAASFI